MDTIPSSAEAVPLPDTFGGEIIQDGLDAGIKEKAAEPSGVIETIQARCSVVSEQHSSKGGLDSHSSKVDHEYFAVKTSDDLESDLPVDIDTTVVEASASEVVIIEGGSQPLTAEDQGLVSPPPGILAQLMRSLSTPMMGDENEDWVGAEDPDWKADHQLTWEQLTDVREIGKGLTCTVYTARIPGRKSKVIAKVARKRNKGRLEDQAEKQLEAEFNVLRQVKHPHVVQLLGAGFTSEGRRFLLLEHLPEGTLGTFHALSAKEEMRGPSRYKLLKEGFRRLTKDISFSLGRVLQVAEAIRYLQTEAIPGAAIIHRDIRPDNIGLAPGGVVKIFDFGLSKAAMMGEGEELLCPLRGEAGSLRYAAPEVSMGLAHGVKVDIYSWALLAWAVVSAREPFEAIGRSTFYERVVIGGERPAVDAGWPAEFQELLKECWIGDPSLRPDINQVVTRMKDLLASIPGANRRASYS